MEDFEDDDAVGAALKSRRIPHGRSRNKQGRGKGGSSKTASFDPLRARGRYEVSLGSSKAPSHSWLEIHELTPDHDALIGTFEFEGKEQGMCVLAGSRRGLAKAIQALDSSEELRADDGDVAEADDTDDDGSPDPDSESIAGESKSVLEDQDDRLNRSTKSFEKNTFRSPKFWMAWRSSRRPRNAGEPSDGEQKSSAYLVFSGNDCQRFEGTISSSALGWDNRKLRGRKIHSRESACPLRWSDVS